MDLRRIKSCPELFICPCHQYFLRSFLCWDSPICVSHELHLYVLVFLLCVRPGMLSSLWKGLWLFGGCFAEVYFGWFREGAGKRQQMSRATSPLCFHWAGSKSLIRKQCPRALPPELLLSREPDSCIMQIFVVIVICGDNLCVPDTIAAHENGTWKEKSGFASDSNKSQFLLYWVCGENFTTPPLTQSTWTMEKSPFRNQ